MTEDELNAFSRDPDHEAYKGFYLRLRPSIEKDAILPPRGAISEEAELEFQAILKDKSRLLKKDKDALELERRQNEQAAQELKEMFGEEAADYVEPKDAGPVVKADGTEMSRQDIEKVLPRLNNCLIRLHVVRKGQLRDWTIFHFAVIANVMDMPDGSQLKLKHSQPPGYTMDEVRPQLKEEQSPEQ